MTESFGARLRKLRTAAGKSIGELAKEINYSKSYLSKIENDLKPPNPALAKLCDSALDTAGELCASLRQSAAAPDADRYADNEVWVMSYDGNGELRFQPMDRRQLLVGGAGAMLGMALTRGSRPVTDQRVVDALRAAFDHLRHLGTMTSPISVLGPVIAHVNTLRTLARDNGEPVRSELLRLAARVAEYAGWMSQEAGSDHGALWWTARAVEFAEAGQDHGLASYALVRRAEVAMYQHDALTTIELARQAQSDSVVGSRILGLAARCEAQGHALAGDVAAYQRALDRAAEFLTSANGGSEATPVLGSTSVRDQVALVTGWSLYDLGRPREAAAVLDVEAAKIPPSALRARARFGARRALAHAGNGDIDQACVVARDVLADAAHVDSATVRLDLRQLARTLARWRNDAAVRELYPALTAALNTPTSVR